MDGLVSVNVHWGIAFLTQTGIGILGNSSLFCLYNFTFLTAQTVRPTDLILNQLVLANTLVLLSKGIPQAMAALGWKAFLGETGCKLVFYLQRVARGVTLSTTCLLSGFQAIKLCCNVQGWLELRMRCPKYIVSCCFLCWILHFVFNIFIAMHVTGPRNNKNTSLATMYRFCSSPPAGRLVFVVIAVVYSFTDALCLGLMVWTSISMVLVLRRHRQRVQHLRKNGPSPRASCEAKATRTILTLVSMFVSFHILSLVLSLWIRQSKSPSHWLMSISFLVSSGFSTFSPLLFICRDLHATGFCSAH